MGLYTSKDQIVIQTLPDSLNAEIPDNIVVIKKDENKYIIAPAFKITKNDIVVHQKKVAMTGIDFNTNKKKGSQDTYQTIS